MNSAVQAVHGDPLEVLKSETLALHRALEKRVAFPQSFASIAAYTQVLILFYLFQRQLAAYTENYQAQIPCQFALEQRNRLPLIERDMRQLSLPPVFVEGLQALELDSLDEFYGCLYVNEGSTLGGNVIQAAMLKIHGREALDWTHYLNPYGKLMLPMWQSFRSALANEIGSGRVDLDGVVRGAVKTFQYMLDTGSDVIPTLSPSRSPGMCR